MTDPATPSNPEPTPAYSANAGTPGPKQALSLTSFITGLAGVVFSWIPVIGFLGFLSAVAAVILGFIAKGKEPGAPKWMWMVGIIAGFVGILLAIIVFVLTIIPFLLFGAALNDLNGYTG